MTKYKCSDGIDRDKDIEEYIEKHNRLEEVNDLILKLKKERESLIYKISDISFQKIGSGALSAMYRHKGK